MVQISNHTLRSSLIPRFEFPTHFVPVAAFYSYLICKYILKQESRHSTLYTLYHFWKANICIAIGVSGMYWIMFELTRMKNFIMNVGGIYPYTLHIYLKTCLQNPRETVNHWFLPCPINKWVMGYLVALLSMVLAPESQGCMVVWLNYLFCSFLVFLRYITTIRCLYYEGPLCYFPISIVQKILPGFIKNHYGYCSVEQCAKKNR